MMTRSPLFRPDPSTSEMRREAVSAGYYTSPGWQRDYPRLQLVTVGELMADAMPAIPYGVLTFAKAPRVKGTGGAQQVGFELTPPATPRATAD